jgi:hypothetical protein
MRSTPAPSSQIIEPPPAPMDETTTTGIIMGNSAMCSDWLTVACPPSTKATSALVPPISSVTKSAMPNSDAMRTAPVTPAAGPESRVSAGRSRALRAVISPPLERVM